MHIIPPAHEQRPHSFLAFLAVQQEVQRNLTLTRVRKTRELSAERAFAESDCSTLVAGDPNFHVGLKVCFAAVQKSANETTGTQK